MTNIWRRAACQAHIVHGSKHAQIINELLQKWLMMEADGRPGEAAARYEDEEWRAAVSSWMTLKGCECTHTHRDTHKHTQSSTTGAGRQHLSLKKLAHPSTHPLRAHPQPPPCLCPCTQIWLKSGKSHASILAAHCWNFTLPSLFIHFWLAAQPIWLFCFILTAWSANFCGTKPSFYSHRTVHQAMRKPFLCVHVHVLMW